jgi:hypothetical protein
MGRNKRNASRDVTRKEMRKRVNREEKSHNGR